MLYENLEERKRKRDWLNLIFSEYDYGHSSREELFFEFIRAMRYYDGADILEVVDQGYRGFAEELYKEAAAFLATDWDDGTASQKSVASFRAKFKKDFGLPFFLPIPPGCQALSKSLREVFMVGSRETETQGFYLQSQIQPFFTQAALGYFRAGYGDNCFYYVKADENHKVFIRCELGGLYSSDKDPGLATVKKLAEYDQIRKTAKREGSKLRYIDSMGWFRYRIQDKLGVYHHFPERTAAASVDQELNQLLAGCEDPFEGS